MARCGKGSCQKGAVYSLPGTLTTIARIVNNSFVANTFARVWKTAEVTPILKFDNPDVPNN